MQPEEKDLQYVGPPRLIYFAESLRDEIDLYVNDPNAAISKVRKAAEGGNGDAAAAIANMYLNRSIASEDSKETHRWARLAMENDSTYGYWVEGWALAEDGRIVDGISKLGEALDRGFPPAALDMGVIYQMGWGIAVDRELSYEYFQKAADLGHLSAKWSLLNLGTTGDFGLIYAFFCWLRRPLAKLNWHFRVLFGKKLSAYTLFYPYKDRMSAIYR